MPTEPMYKCPNFQKCNAPKCPLDPDMSARIKLPEDPVCTLDKKTRMEVGKDLENKGLFSSELRSYKGWRNRSAEGRSKTLQNIAVFGAKTRFACRVQS